MLNHKKKLNRHFRNIVTLLFFLNTRQCLQIENYIHLKIFKSKYKNCKTASASKWVKCFTIWSLLTLSLYIQFSQTPLPLCFNLTKIIPVQNVTVLAPFTFCTYSCFCLEPSSYTDPPPHTLILMFSYYTSLEVFPQAHENYLWLFTVLPDYRLLQHLLTDTML